LFAKSRVRRSIKKAPGSIGKPTIPLLDCKTKGGGEGIEIFNDSCFVRQTSPVHGMVLLPFGVSVEQSEQAERGR